MDKSQAPQMNPSSLWREEVFTDREVGTIRRLTPVKSDGCPDPARKPVFTGEAALATPAGQLPITFEIPADDLAQAVARYGAELEKAYHETVQQLQELRRQASQKIVVPGALPPGDFLQRGGPPAPGKLKF